MDESGAGTEGQLPEWILNRVSVRMDLRAVEGRRPTRTLDPDGDAHAEVVGGAQQPVDHPHPGGRRFDDGKIFVQAPCALHEHEQPRQENLVDGHGSRSMPGLGASDSVQHRALGHELKGPEDGAEDRQHIEMDEPGVGNLANRRGPADKAREGPGVVASSRGFRCTRCRLSWPVFQKQASCRRRRGRHGQHAGGREDEEGLAKRGRAEAVEKGFERAPERRRPESCHGRSVLVSAKCNW